MLLTDPQNARHIVEKWILFRLDLFEKKVCFQRYIYVKQGDMPPRKRGA
jgi:hypothetical protein